MQTKPLPLARLWLDGDTQPREKLDPVTVAAYTADLEAGAKLPPIDVFYDGAAYWVADGFHRHHAHQEAKRDQIDCTVHKGTVDDARWFALSANKTHGLRRTNADKARAVKRALTHPNSADMSDGKIAEHVGVSDVTIGKYRRLSGSTPKSLESTQRKGKDGRTINTSKIGAKPADSIASEIKPAETDVDPVTADSVPPPSQHDEQFCPECDQHVAACGCNHHDTPEPLVLTSDQKSQLSALIGRHVDWLEEQERLADDLVWTKFGQHIQRAGRVIAAELEE